MEQNALRRDGRILKRAISPGKLCAYRDVAVTADMPQAMRTGGQVVQISAVGKKKKIASGKKK